MDKDEIFLEGEYKTNKVNDSNTDFHTSSLADKIDESNRYDGSIKDGSSSAPVINNSDKANRYKPENNIPNSVKPENNDLTGVKGSDSNSNGGQPAGNSPVGGKPAGNSPVGGKPAGNSPVGGKPAGNSPVGGKPAGNSPVGGKPANGIPNSGSDLKNEAAKQAAKKAATAVNPALGALANSKLGDKIMDKALNKKKFGLPGVPNLNPLSDDKNTENENPSDQEGEPSKSQFEQLTGFKPEPFKKVILIAGPILPILLIVLTVASVGIIKPSVIDVGKSSDVNTEGHESEGTDLNQVSNQVENQKTGYGRNDNDNSISYVSTVNVSSSSEFDKKMFDDFIGNNNLCTDEEECSSTVTDRFFTKLYDIYYLYLSKYNVKLNIPLLLSSIVSKDEEFNYGSYLSDYDRKYIVDCDWNPVEVTPLDWDYDYESQENYLVSNDSSLDLQVLAKNMVSKSGDSYKLDLDKYDDFLLEYLEKKYYLNRFTSHPVSTNGPDYVTDKKPGVLSRIKNKSNSNSASSTNLDSSNVITRLNEIALGEVGNGPDKYLSYFSTSGDWCGYFVSWLFEQVDNKNNKFITTAGGAGEIPRATLRNNLGGTWLEDECHDSSTVPKAGDIILFDPQFGNQYISYPNNGNDQYLSSHVGYVYKVDDERVYTVEGNSSGNKVNKRDYPRNYCNNSSIQGINGYFRPDYSKASNSNNSSNNSNTSSSSNNVGSVSVNSFKGLPNNYIYYNQYDYSQYSYGGYGTIASHGCGPTSLAIAISSMLQERHDPIELTDYVCSIGGCSDSGSYYLKVFDVARIYGEKYGFKTQNTSDLDLVRKKLASGNAYVVTITNGGFYTNSGNLISSGGHYFVLAGLNKDGDIYLLDPANSNNTGRTINLEKLAINSNNREAAPSFCILYK